MKQRDKAADKAVKALRRNTLTLERRNAPKTVRRRKPSAADANENIALLTRERNEALEQQTATSEVLTIISSSPGELEPVFNAILTNATRICEAKFGMLVLTEGEKFQMAAMHDVPLAWAEKRTREAVFTPGPSNNLVLAVQTKKTQHVADLKRHQSFIDREPAAVALAKIAGARTLVVVPMLKENEPVGAIAVYREEVRPFTAKQIELVTNFAAQAVIAIENARLLKELRQRTDDRDGTEALIRAMERGVLVQRSTDPRLIIVVSIAYDLAQVRLTEHDHVVQAFSADRAARV